MTTTLTDFLLARIAEDEAVAHTRHAESCDRFNPPGFPCDCGYPARVLAECEAKRRIVAAHELSPYYGLDQSGRRLPREGEPKFWYCDCESGDGMIGRDGPCDTLRALALPYADHPDYREEWRP